MCSELLIFWRPTSLTLHAHKLERLVKRLLCCIQGQGHTEGSGLQWMFARTISLISDRSNLVCWYIIISQSIIQKYHFARFKVKSTIVSTRSSEILKLLQPKLVRWYIITRQAKTLWKDFLAFTHRAWDTEYGFGDCRLDCCTSWTSRYLKQGWVPVPVKKMWKEHCLCNEYTCL